MPSILLHKWISHRRFNTIIVALQSELLAIIYALTVLELNYLLDSSAAALLLIDSQSDSLRAARALAGYKNYVLACWTTSWTGSSSFYLEGTFFIFALDGYSSLAGNS